jgi:hypothetical protein
MNVVRTAAGRRSAVRHFHGDDPRREVWTGKWPGEEDCERLNFFVNGDGSFPDDYFFRRAVTLAPVARATATCKWLAHRSSAAFFSAA